MERLNIHVVSVPGEEKESGREADILHNWWMMKILTSGNPVSSKLKREREKKKNAYLKRHMVVKE